MNEYYPLPAFRVHSLDSVAEIIRSYPLATVISGAAGDAVTSLLPLVVDSARDGSSERLLYLSGHLDRNNEHASLLEEGHPVSFLFQGPDAYASPDIYPSRQLPGWLYVVVKGDGFVQCRLDETALRSLLVRSSRDFGSLDQRFELSKDNPGIDRFINDIVGFRIRVTRVSAVAKLAQDKGRADSQLAQEFLLSRDNRGSAALFERLFRETISDKKPAVDE